MEPLFDINITDRYGNTQLMRACQDNDLHMVDLLLTVGADVRIANATGASALHIAMHYAGVGIIRRLSQYGADFEQEDHFGKKPFDYIRDHRCSHNKKIRVAG